MGKKNALARQTDGNLRSSQIALTDNTTTVYTGAGYIVGIHVNAGALSHACVIKDGTTPIFTIPAGAVAGTQYNGFNAEFLTSLVVDPDDLETTGNVTVVYMPYYE